MTPAKAEEFISKLSQELIKNNFKIVSGFGLGVGSSVINGVLEEVYLNKKENLKNQLLLRPFPQGEKGKVQWTDYRKDMISYAGVSIFLFGNKLEDGQLKLANGVRSEFEITIEQGAIALPIGATGYMAKQIWEEMLADYSSYFGSEDNIKLYKALGDENLAPEKLIELIIEFISKLIEK